jgi:hypothetical protein
MAATIIRCAMVSIMTVLCKAKRPTRATEMIVTRRQHCRQNCGRRRELLSPPFVCKNGSIG